MALMESRMEMRQVLVKNFHLVSYNRFDSRGEDDDDDKREDSLAERSVRNIDTGAVPTRMDTFRKEKWA